MKQAARKQTPGKSPARRAPASNKKTQRPKAVKKPSARKRGRRPQTRSPKKGKAMYYVIDGNAVDEPTDLSEIPDLDGGPWMHGQPINFRVP